MSAVPPASPGPESMPWWLAPTAVVILAVGAGAVIWACRDAPADPPPGAGPPRPPPTAPAGPPPPDGPARRTDSGRSSTDWDTGTPPGAVGTGYAGVTPPAASAAGADRLPASYWATRSGGSRR